MKAFLCGLLAAVFFSVTFVINRSMELDGGSWIWSASLRFFFMLPILAIIVGYQKNIKPVLIHIKNNPLSWVIWSIVGFGLFYAPITFATVYGPGWLVAATFQLTIISGSLLVPFLQSNNTVKQKIPLKSVFISCIILAGVFTIQLEHAQSVSVKSALLGSLPVVVSAIAYPLGNRKMMQIVNNELTTFQRILGMTIASMPFWIILSIFELVTEDMPSSSQVSQTFVVAISSGIIATSLFFYATEQVKDHTHKLAAVEATQSGEVVFALLGEILFLHATFPNLISIFGILLVMIGMIFHSLSSGFKIPKGKTVKVSHRVENKTYEYK